MAAMIETMAYAGKVPWHGEGVEISEDATIEETQTAAGLDWTVSKRPVLFNPAGAENTLDTLSFKDRFVLARDTDDRPYCVVSSRYKPVQPKQIFETFRDLLSRYNMKMHTAGSLSNGARIWCLAQTGDVHKVLGVDAVDSYLLMSTSYDLTLSTLAQFTSVRVVCNNTLQQALKDSTGRVVIPHISNFNAEDVHDQLGIGREQWAAFCRTLDVFGKMKLDVAKAAQVIDKVFDLPEEAELRMADSDRVHADNVVQMFRDQAYIGADLSGETGWGLLSCVTEYVDFKKRARNQSNRLNAAWFGEGAGIKARAIGELERLAA